MTSELWDKFVASFVKDRDFPLNREKPTINNHPKNNLPAGAVVRPGLLVLPCRGMFRAYLRRRARGRL